MVSLYISVLIVPTISTPILFHVIYVCTLEHSTIPYIYIFADADIKAYGTVYNDIDVSLAMSKSFVTPLKMLTLPRLELWLV